MTGQRRRRGHPWEAVDFTAKIENTAVKYANVRNKGIAREGAGAFLNMRSLAEARPGTCDADGNGEGEVDLAAGADGAPAQRGDTRPEAQGAAQEDIVTTCEGADNGGAENRSVRIGHALTEQGVKDAGRFAGCPALAFDNGLAVIEVRFSSSA